MHGHGGVGDVGALSFDRKSCDVSLTLPSKGGARSGPRNAFEGRKVRLRGVEPDDWPLFLEMASDTDSARSLGAANLPMSAAAARQWAVDVGARKGSETIPLVIEAHEDGGIGFLRVTKQDYRNRLLSYTIGLTPDYRRAGYGTEAVSLLLSFFFRDLDFHRAEVAVYAFNTASVAFHEKLGFEVEGVRRECYLAMGQYHDVLIMGLLSRDLLPPTGK